MDLVTRKRKAQTLEEQGDTAKALQVYQKILAELERNGDGLKEIPLYVKTGDLFALERNGKAAVKMYDRAAQRYAVQGSGRHVISLCAKINRLAPQLDRLHHRYAGLLIKRGHVSEAHRVLTAYAQVAELEEMTEVLDVLEGLEDNVVQPLLQQFVDADDDDSAVAAAKELLDAIIEPEEEEEEEQPLNNRPVRPSIVTANIASDDIDDPSEASTTVVEPGLIQSSAEFIVSKPAPGSAAARRSSGDQEPVEWFGGFVPEEAKGEEPEPEYDEAAAEYEDEPEDSYEEAEEEEEYAEASASDDSSGVEFVASPEVDFGTADAEEFHDPAESDHAPASARADGGAEDGEGYVVKSGVGWDSEIDHVRDSSPFHAQPDLRASGTFESLLESESAEAAPARLPGGSGAFETPVEKVDPPKPAAEPAPAMSVDTERPSGMVEATTESAQSESEIESIEVDEMSLFSLGPPTIEMAPVVPDAEPRTSGGFGPPSPSMGFAPPAARPSFAPPSPVAHNSFAPPPSPPARPTPRPTPRPEARSSAGYQVPEPKLRRRRRFPMRTAAAILLLAAGFGLYRSGFNPQALLEKWGVNEIIAQSRAEPQSEPVDLSPPPPDAPVVELDISELRLPGQVEIGPPSSPPSLDLADAQGRDGAASPASPSGS